PGCYRIPRAVYREGTGPPGSCLSGGYSIPPAHRQPPRPWLPFVVSRRSPVQRRPAGRCASARSQSLPRAVRRAARPRALWLSCARHPPPRSILGDRPGGLHSEFGSGRNRLLADLVGYLHGDFIPSGLERLKGNELPQRDLLSGLPEIRRGLALAYQFLRGSAVDPRDHVIQAHVGLVRLLIHAQIIDLQVDSQPLLLAETLVHPRANLVFPDDELAQPDLLRGNPLDLVGQDHR